MEFWGIEVKSGQTLPVYPGDISVIHLSQANIGEHKKEKGGESICLYVTVDGKKLVLATLNTEKLPQQQFDLVFDRKFELSHNWKNGSVFFIGYRADKPGLESDDELDTDEDLEAFNAEPPCQPKTETPAVQEKEGAAKESAAVQEKDSAAKESAGKKKVKISEPKEVQKEDEDDESSDEDVDMDADDDESDSLELDEEEDDSDSEDEESEDEETPKKVQSGKKKPAESKKKTPLPAKKDEDESDSEDEESEEEETPKKKVQSGKKRPAESSKKTPLPAKKVKMATPQKTDGKKSNDHVATPHPSKKPGKTAGKQTPKSAGSHQCKQCDRSFTTESGLGSHTKDKHGAAAK